MLKKSPSSIEEFKKKHPSVVYNKNVMKIEIENKNKNEVFDFSDTENQEYKYMIENLYKLQSMSSSEGFK